MGPEGEGSDASGRRIYPPMRKTDVPHTGQVPFVAGFPFFITIRWGF